MRHIARFPCLLLLVNQKLLGKHSLQKPDINKRSEKQLIQYRILTRLLSSGLVTSMGEAVKFIGNFQ